MSHSKIPSEFKGDYNLDISHSLFQRIQAYVTNSYKTLGAIGLLTTIVTFLKSVGGEILKIPYADAVAQYSNPTVIAVTGFGVSLINLIQVSLAHHQLRTTIPQELKEYHKKLDNLEGKMNFLRLVIDRTVKESDTSLGSFEFVIGSWDLQFSETFREISLTLDTIINNLKEARKSAGSNRDKGHVAIIIGILGLVISIPLFIVPPAGGSTFIASVALLAGTSAAAVIIGFLCSHAAKKVLKETENMLDRVKLLEEKINLLLHQYLAARDEAKKKWDSLSQAPSPVTTKTKVTKQAKVKTTSKQANLSVTPDFKNLTPQEKFDVLLSSGNLSVEEIGIYFQGVEDLLKKSL